MPNLVPKIVSILYLVTLLVAWSLSGWLDSPIRFYKSFYGAAVFTDIPQASQNALEHISVTMTQLYLMYAVTFIMLARSGQAAPFSMVLGHVFCMVCLLGELLVPMPTARTVRIGSTTIPFLDPIPAVFGFLFLLGFLCSSSVESSSKTRNISHVCKVWTILYLALVAANTVPTILMEPSNLYIHELGRTFAKQTSNAVQLIMMRVGWIVCATQLLMAVTMIASVFLWKQTHQLLYFPLFYYLIHMLYVQLHYPWHPYANQLIPFLSEKDGVLLMPPWMVCAGTLIGSLVSLYAQKELDAEEERLQTEVAAVEQQTPAASAVAAAEKES